VPADRKHTRPALVLSCAALAADVRAITRTAGWEHVDFEYLPATFHNHPEKIVPAVEHILDRRGADYETILIGYGDCGTGGQLDRLLAKHANADRLPGEHCYAFLSGADDFDREFRDEIGTFFLTDFLAKHCETLVFGALGLHDHPELLEAYFGNYTRLLYLAQNPTTKLTEAARSCAKRLNLKFEQSNVGRGRLESNLLNIRTAA